MALTVVLLVAFGTSLLATRAAIPVAHRLGVLDHPGELKVQQRPIPYLGGAGVALGLAAGVLVATAARHDAKLLIPIGMSSILGLADDLAHVPPWARLAVEVIIAVSVAWLIPIRMGWVGRPLVTVAAVVLMNGINMIDGLDALAGGVTAVSLLGFAAVGLDDLTRALALAGFGAAAGFLAWNRPPARIYLGDSGAYLLGTTLACLLALSWRSSVPTSRSIAALGLVGYPAGELLMAVVRRRLAGLPLFAGDRGHLYDRLVRRGVSPNKASATFVGLHATAVAVVLIASRFGPLGAGVALVACAVAGGIGAVCLGVLAPGASSGGANGAGR